MGRTPGQKKEEFEEIQQEATKHDQIGSSGKSKTGTCAPTPKEASLAHFQVWTKWKEGSKVIPQSQLGLSQKTGIFHRKPVQSDYIIYEHSALWGTYYTSGHESQTESGFPLNYEENLRRLTFDLV